MAVISDLIVLRDNFDAPITGKVKADFAAIEAYLLPNGTPTAVVSLTEIGGGEYAVSFEPSSTGTWAFHYVYQSGLIFEEDTRTYVVTTEAQAAIPISVDTGVNRATLRREILGKLGDFRLLTATKDGTDVTFVDARNLVGEVGAYGGREFLVTAATNPANVGEIRYVTGSSKVDRAIGFGEALPAATKAGDTGELVNLRGTGYRVADVHDAINAAIRAAAGSALVPVEGSVATFSRADGTVAIPATIREVTGLLWQEDQGDLLQWRPINRTFKAGGFGWWVNRATRTLFVAGDDAWRADGRSVKVLGLGSPAELTTDAETTQVNAEWLVSEAKAQLLEAGFLRQPTPERERFAFLARQQANLLRPKLMVRSGPGAVRL